MTVARTAARVFDGVMSTPSIDPNGPGDPVDPVDPDTIEPDVVPSLDPDPGDPTPVAPPPQTEPRIPE